MYYILQRKSVPMDCVKHILTEKKLNSEIIYDRDENNIAVNPIKIG